MQATIKLKPSSSDGGKSKNSVIRHPDKDREHSDDLQKCDTVER